MSKMVLRIVIISIIVLIMWSVSPLIDSYYQYKFTNMILVNNPNAHFNYYYDAERIQSDKNFLYGIYGFIGLMLLVLLYANESLQTVKKIAANPPQGVMFKIFFLRFIAFLFIIAALMVSTVVFEDLISNNVDTSTNLFAAGVILLACNVFILSPYVACLGIYNGFKGSTFFKLCLLVTIVMAICMALGIKKYAAGGVAALIGSFGISKTFADEFKNMEVFFGIEGKTITEMFSSTSPVYYPSHIKVSDTIKEEIIENDNKKQTTTNDVVFYAPKGKSDIFLVAFGFIAVFLGYIGFRLFDVTEPFSPSILFIIISLTALYFFILVLKNRKNAVLLRIGSENFTCVDTDFLTSAKSNNQLSVLYRLYLFPKYKEYPFKNIRKFDIQYNTPIGPVLMVFPKNDEKRGVVFYFDASVTTEYVLHLLQSKLTEQ